MKTENSCHGRGENGSSYGELQRDKPDEMSVVGKLNGKLYAFCFFLCFWTICRPQVIIPWLHRNDVVALCSS